MYRKTKLFGENIIRNYKIDATIYTEVWKMAGKLDTGLNFVTLTAVISTNEGLQISQLILIN
jgi:hypothetical protein